MKHIYKNQWIQSNPSKIALNRGLSSSIEGLLASRFTDEELEDFFHPQFLEEEIAGTKEARERIKEAIEKNEKIVIFGDYDVDGITASALLFRVLKRLGANPFVILPSRYEDGYGLNEKSVRKIPACDLLITVDTGISSYKEIEELKKRMDVIVTDHHELPEVIPNCIVINPKISYPSKMLAGVGVALKLAYALTELTDDEWVLSMMGSISDVVPLLGENRYIVKKGLEVVKNTKIKGLLILCKALKLDPNALTAYHFGFRVGPVLNASGRLDDPTLAFHLLTSEDEVLLRDLASKLLKLNEERKSKEQSIVNGVKVSDHFIVDYNPEWLTGILGLAASKVSNKEKLPCILLQEEGGVLKGSGRSIGDFSLLEALRANASLLTRFGGHKSACGLELPLENYEAFVSGLKDFSKEHLSEKDRYPVLEYVPMELGDINLSLLNELDLLMPFGEGNPEPLFRLDGLTLESIKRMGKENQFARLTFRKEARSLEFLLFQKPFIEFKEGVEYDLLFRVQRNEFLGVVRLQLLLEDAHYSVAQIDSFSPRYLESLEHFHELLFHYGEGISHGSLFLEDDEPLTKLSKESVLSGETSRIHGFFEAIPDRDKLIELYKRWKENPVVTFEEGLTGFLGLKIFEELQLISYTNKEREFKVTFLEVEQKKNIQTSKTFQKGLEAKEDFYGLKRYGSSH
ncbi:single-stranded-DNA-specific exonuclease RecJ [Guggenheimella bovis]